MIYEEGWDRILGRTRRLLIIADLMASLSAWSISALIMSHFSVSLFLKGYSEGTTFCRKNRKHLRKATEIRISKYDNQGRRQNSIFEGG